VHERAPSLRKRFAPDRPRCWRARNWRRRAAEVAHRRLKSMPCSYFFVSLRYPPVMLISGLSRPRASAFAARFPLIGSSISFCPAAAFVCDVSIHWVDNVFTLRPRLRSNRLAATLPRQAQALVAQGRRALGRNHLRHNRRNPPSIYAHRMRQPFPKLRLCPILKASCSSLRPARARPAVRRRGPLPLPLRLSLRPRPLRLHQDLGAASCCP
jgi:hypothetical protein